jgi:arylsulfatase A-like enzyme
MVDDPSWVGAPALPARPGARHRPYDNSRTWFKREEDFPGPKTMSTAVDWLQTNAGQHDRFMLFIDEFDPHEPFDTPEPWASRYDPDWEGPRMIWPPYATRVLEDGVLTEDEARHVRANYGGKLSMIDHWFGKLLDAVDDQDLWKDTAVIVCTDHGHYLGEHDAFGKPDMPIYNTMGHIPLMIAWPGLAPGVTDALSTNVDIFATLADVFGVEPGHRTHGRSLVPVIEGRADSVREWLLSGIYGRYVHVVDRERKYARARVKRENLPLSMWSNRWSTMPVHAMPQIRLPKPDRRATLDFMPGSDVPVIRQRFQPGDMLPYWASGGRAGDHMLFDVDGDPGEENNRVGSPDEKRAIDLLRAAIEEIEAPREQFERLGIA